MAESRRTPLHVWLPLALLLGVGGSVLLNTFLFGSPVFSRNMLLTILVGTLFAVVLWGGFLYVGDFLQRGLHQGSPHRAALRFYLGWILFCILLFAFASGLVRLLLGINVLRNSAAAFSSLILTVLISSLITGYYILVDRLKDARALALAQTRAQALTLKAQLSPHTLFNSLNTIAALIPDDPKEAERSVERLSRLMRRILEALEQETWPLKEEFDLLEDLLTFERARYGERLSWSLHLEPLEADRQVPPLLILPLVENALKHGFRSKVGPCRLEVRAEAGSICVVDDGVGMVRDATEGLGLRTVRTRLEGRGGTLLHRPSTQGCLWEVQLWP